MINDVRAKAKIEEAAELESSLVAETVLGHHQAASLSYAYHEVSDHHVVQVDVLEQLKSNIVQLEDLHARLRFMMGEVGSLLKTRK